MKSNIKTKLTTEQINSLVKLNFPSQQIINIKEIPDGNINSIYIITVKSKNTNSKIVLKAGMKDDADCLRYEKKLFPTELKVYNLLKEKNIPVPKVLKADMSCKNLSCGYIFMEYIEGNTWNKVSKQLNHNEKKFLMDKLGEYNAQISSIKGDYFGYLKEEQQYHFKTHSEMFSSIISDILTDGKEHNITLPYEEIENIFKKYEECLNEVTEPRLVDFDLWAGNIFLVKKETFQISGIIDFGHCFYGDAYAAFTSAVHIFDNIENEPDFINGYERILGKKLIVTENHKIRMNLYRLYMALLCAVETYRYEKNIGIKIRAHHLSKINNLLKKLNKD